MLQMFGEKKISTKSLYICCQCAGLFNLLRFMTF